MKGETIKRKLARMGKSQSELARLLKVSPQSVSKILNADDVRTATLERICKVLNLPASFFYDDTTNTPKVDSPSTEELSYLRGKLDGYREAIELLHAQSNDIKKQKTV